jgi:hypothetical protein
MRALLALAALLFGGLRTPLQTPANPSAHAADSTKSAAQATDSGKLSKEIADRR